MTGHDMRGWADRYTPPREQDQPIDVEAFRMRAHQRGRTRALLAGKVKTGGETRSSYIRSRYELAMSQNMRAEHDAVERRQVDPVERARLFLQRRGFVVFAAIVTDGPRGQWKVGGRADYLTSEQLLELAIAKGFVS